MSKNKLIFAIIILGFHLTHAQTEISFKIYKL